MEADRLRKAITEQTNSEFAGVMVEDLENQYEELKSSSKIRDNLAVFLEKHPQSVFLLTTITAVKEKMAIAENDDFEHKYLYNQIDDVINITMPIILKMADEAKKSQDVVMDKVMNSGIMDPMDIPEGSSIMLDEKGYGYALTLVDNESEISPDKSSAEVYSELKEKCAHPDAVKDFLQEITDRTRAAGLAMKLFGEKSQSREDADNPKVAELCTKFPHIALVAVIKENINSYEEFEKAINLPENVHLGRELDLQYQVDANQHNRPLDENYRKSVESKIDDKYAATIHERVEFLLHSEGGR